MKACDPKDIAMKSFFLGPQAENAEWVLDEVKQIFKHWFKSRQSFCPEDGKAIADHEIASELFQEKKEKMTQHLKDLMKDYEKEVPKFSPRYIGHMVSEISLPAILGHILNLLHNPNNISDEVSQVGVRIEYEAIEMLSQMIGYQKGNGHFTSGGTIANIEAIWRARFALDSWLSLACLLKDKNLTDQSLFELCHMGWDFCEEQRSQFKEEEIRKFSGVIDNPYVVVEKINSLFQINYRGPVILVPGNKHYSWQKGLSLLGYGSEAFWSISLDERGKLCVKDLENKIEKAKSENRPILMVVSVAGTTELGELDPVDKVQKLLDSYKKTGIHIWHHVDAAYGGFYCAISEGNLNQHLLSSSSVKALSAISAADSVTLDPHKLGYVPYACGAILTKDVRHYQVSSFSAPYLVKNNKNGKLCSKWLSTIEGSRSASGAAATWLTGKSIGFHSEGYGRILNKGIEFRVQLEEMIRNDLPECKLLPYMDTNILCFCVVKNKGESISKVSERSKFIFEASNVSDGFGVSKTSLGLSEYQAYLQNFIKEWDGHIDANSLTFVRIVLMNPFFGSKQMNKDYNMEFAEWVRSIIHLMD